MGLVGVYAVVAASVAIAVAAIVYAVRRAGILAWCLALTSILSAALFAASNWVAMSLAPQDPAQSLVIMRVVGPVSEVVGVLFGVALVLVLIRDSRVPSSKRIEREPQG